MGHRIEINKSSLYELTRRSEGLLSDEDRPQRHDLLLQRLKGENGKLNFDADFLFSNCIC